MPSVTESNNALYPLAYKWAFDLWELQQNNHWMPKEATMGDDLTDFQDKLTLAEQNLVVQILRLFTKSDEEIANCYQEKYLAIFKRTEIKMMLTAFMNIETVHYVAYAHLVQSLQLPEAEFLAFQEYDEMRAKLDFLQDFDVNDDLAVAKAMIAFSGATEGMSLFASFAILLNFPRHNKLKGMADIIGWSVRDESTHCEGIAMLFKEFISEKGITHSMLRTPAMEIFERAVANEDKFIDLAFAMGPVEGLTPEDMKKYIRWIANLRFNQLGFEGHIYKPEPMPLPWLPAMLNAPEFGNFFETRVTDYSKASTGGDWEDAYDF